MPGVSVSGVSVSGVSIPNVLGAAGTPPGGQRYRRPGRVLLPAMAAALLVTLMLEVVSALIGYGVEGEDTLSVLLGVAALAVTVLPITVVLLHRAVGGWRGVGVSPADR